jgi:hypothetical protein
MIQNVFKIKFCVEKHQKGKKITTENQDEELKFASNKISPCFIENHLSRDTSQPIARIPCTYTGASNKSIVGAPVVLRQWADLLLSKIPFRVKIIWGKLKTQSYDMSLFTLESSK